MTTQCRLLFNEEPITINRLAAKVLGLNEAIVVQPIHYWLNINEKAKKNFINGKYWTFNTYDKWQNENFDFWSTRTVRRVFEKLFKNGILFKGKFNKKKYDQTLWVSINYDRLEELLNAYENDTNPSEPTKIEINLDDIPNGVDVERFSKVAVSDFRKEFSIPNDRKLILCVSRIDPQKNQLALLEMLDALLKRGENAHLALVGFITDNSYLQKINELAKTLKLSERLTICNGLPPESDLLLSAYKSADVFALASIHEPFGIVALEAWASGTPVIASNVGGLGRLIENGKTGFLFQVNDTPSAIDAFYDAQNYKDEICQNAYSLCAEKYSWQAVAKQTLDFYRSLKR